MASTRTVERAPRVLALVCRTAPEVYGGTRSLLLALERVRDAAVQVTLLSAVPGDPLAAQLAERGIRHEVRRVPHPGPRLRSWRGLRYLLRSNAAAARAIRRFNPDLVHVDVESFLFAGPAALLLRRPVLQHVRGVQSTGTVRWFRRLSMLMARRNVFVTPSLQQFYLASLRGWVRRRVAARSTVISNGIDHSAARALLATTTREQARGRVGFQPDEVAIVVVGRLEPGKCQLELIRRVAPRVAREVPSARFYFVGGAENRPYLERCQAAVRDAGIESRVTFAGYRDDTPWWYRAMDVLAFPSSAEGFGRVAAEAQAYGVPVVALDVVGVRDAVEDGVGGWLTPDLEAFAERLTGLALDPALRARMGEQGRVWARRFDADTVAHALEAEYVAAARATERAP